MMKPLIFRVHAIQRMFERGITQADTIIIITAYEPDPTLWDAGYKTKKDTN